MTTPPPAHHITAKVCSCCGRARWFCPSCSLDGYWPAPTPAPTWPVQFQGACPRCRATAELLIFGDEPDPAVGALERALQLPPARRPRRGFGAA
jgi:hypothetical protein